MKRVGIIIVGLTGLVALVLASSAGAFPPERPMAQGGAPPLISYQGVVKVDGAALTGSGQFKFAIVNAEGNKTYWSNDGTSVGGSEPTDSVSLSVVDGLFNVLLGDTSLVGMSEALNASVFSTTETYLRVWFNDGGTGFQQLSPDQRIASVPYALNADRLDGQEASDFQGKYVRTVVVSPVPGDAVASGAALLDALAGISDASATNPYLLKIEPGVYDLGIGALSMKEYVDIEGSGELVTKITAVGSASSTTGTLVGADNAELRFLTVENTGGNTHATAIYNSSASPRLTHMTANASGGTEKNFGVRSKFSSLTMTNVTATAFGGINAIGVYNEYSSVTMTNTTATASGGTNNYGIYNNATSGSYTVRVHNSWIAGSTNTISNLFRFTTRVSASLLDGGPASTGGTMICAGVYDENYNFYANTCP